MSRSSAVIPGYKEIGIHGDHRDMIRFASEKDPGFISIAGELRRWIAEIVSHLTLEAVTKRDPADATLSPETTTNANIRIGGISIVGSVTNSSIVGGSQIINGPLIFS